MQRDRGSPSRGDGGLQDYVEELENQLMVKTGLLDEALRLHRIFHGRLTTLSEGLQEKDRSAEELTASFYNIISDTLKLLT